MSLRQLPPSPDTQLDLVAFSFQPCHFSALCAAGYTRTDLKGLELGKEELRVLELKLKALIMDCIHLIDMVQQLLAADTRSTQEWQWQKQIRWCACVCMHVCLRTVCVGAFGFQLWINPMVFHIATIYHLLSIIPFPLQCRV